MQTIKTQIQKAFSLVELLVVFSVLAILLSLLQPTMVKILQSADTLSCAQNLHQYYNAIYLYIDDNDETFIPYAWGSTVPAHLDKLMWFEQLAPYHDQHDKVRVCPSTTEPTARGAWGSTDSAWKWHGMSGSYAYNAYFHSVYYRMGSNLSDMPPWFENFHFIKMSRVDHPSDTGILADSSWVDAWPRNFQAGPASASLGGRPGETSMARIAVNRHDWATNVLKADGSVGKHRLEELWTSVYWNKNDKPQNAPTINP